MTGLLRQGKLRLTAVRPPCAQPTCIRVEERDLCSLPPRPTPPLIPSQQVLSGLCCSLYASVYICMHSWSARTGHMQIHVPVHGCKHAASHAWTHLCGHTCAGMYTSEHRSIQLHSAMPQATGAWAGNDASLCLRAKGCLCGQADEEGITTCVRKGGMTTYTYVHIATTCTTYTYTHVYIHTHTYIGNTYEHRLKAQHVTFETCMAELGCWPCLHVQMVSGPG